VDERTRLPAMPVPSFHTPVRGSAFAAIPPPTDARVTQGAEVALIREPENPADPMAVAVWLLEAGTPRWRIGYLDRTVAVRIAPRLDSGVDVRASIDGWVEEPDGRWRRPLLLITVAEGERPGLGRARSLRRQPPGVRRRRVRRAARS